MKSGLWSELSVPAERRGWTIENAVRAMAGIVVLVSVGLAVYVSMNWLWLAVFVAVNLIQSSFTGWCLMSNLLAIASHRVRPKNASRGPHSCAPAVQRFAIRT